MTKYILVCTKSPDDEYFFQFFFRFLSYIDLLKIYKKDSLVCKIEKINIFETK